MESQFTHVHDTPPPGAAADWTISQDWDAFTADEHAMWDRLFARQSEMLPGRAADLQCEVDDSLGVLGDGFGGGARGPHHLRQRCALVFQSHGQL